MSNFPKFIVDSPCLAYRLHRKRAASVQLRFGKRAVSIWLQTDGARWVLVVRLSVRVDGNATLQEWMKSEREARVALEMICIVQFSGITLTHSCVLPGERTGRGVAYCQKSCPKISLPLA